MGFETVGIIMGCIMSGIVTLWCVALYCCIRRQRQIHNRVQYANAPVVVTSATHTTPGNYPVAQMPPPGPYQSSVYPPYPPPHSGQMPGGHVQMQMPMPMPMPGSQPPAAGIPQHTAPYPPMPAASIDPPSYDMAVAGVGVGAPNVTAYEKQSPYNPNFALH